MWWVDFGTGIASNVASLIVIGAPAWAWYLLYRRRLLTFFGLRDARRVTIYASRLYVPRFTSLGPDGRKRAFEGIATPDYEATVIAFIEVFGGFGRILRRAGLRWGDIEVRGLASPGSKDGIEREGTVITIGSPGYNVVSQMVEDDLLTQVRFANDNRDLTLPDGRLVSNGTFCCVQRTVSPMTGQAVFYLAGPSVAGTIAAARYLLKKWRWLAKWYPDDRSFYVVLRVTSDEQYVVIDKSAAVRRRTWRR